MHAPSATQESQSTATMVPLTPNGTCSSPLAAYAAFTSSFWNASPSCLPGPHLKWKCSASDV